ncbi:hypothetical protein HPB50_027004 [Hyalomma asiaticum]|uniref:Uncharacterized protein n=1 Tax=Hyalomma asiaticum TaxID=266040 RepID=A0ACB7TS61_HYAAI|nr:hypothetical protein HPB50_027004 [Hyalomma asiaticum]
MRNTLKEMVKTHKIVQASRLTTSRPGTRILKSTGSGMIDLLPEIFLKHEVKETHEVDAFPHDIHPKFNER